MDFRGHIVEDPRATFDSTTSKSSRDSILAAVPRLSMKHLSHNHCDRPPRHSSFVNRNKRLKPVLEIVEHSLRITKSSINAIHGELLKNLSLDLTLGTKLLRDTSFRSARRIDHDRCTDPFVHGLLLSLSLSFFTPLLLLIFFQFRFVASKRDTLFHIAPMKLIDEQHLSHRRLPSLSDIFVRCRRTVDVKNCYTHAAFRF